MNYNMKYVFCFWPDNKNEKTSLAISLKYVNNILLPLPLIVLILTVQYIRNDTI